MNHSFIAPACKRPNTLARARRFQRGLLLGGATGMVFSLGATPLLAQPLAGTVSASAPSFSPEAARAALKRARVQEEAGSVALAAVQFREALAQSPNDASVARELARFYARQNRFEEAGIEWKRVLILKSGDAEATRELARLSHQSPKHKETAGTGVADVAPLPPVTATTTRTRAVAITRPRISLAPSDASSSGARVLLAQNATSNSLPEAPQSLPAGVTAESSESAPVPRARVGAVPAATRVSPIPFSLPARRSVKVSDKNRIAAFAFANRGGQLLAAKRADLALAQYQKAEQLDPTNIYATPGVATSLMILGRYDESASALRRYLSVAPAKVAKKDRYGYDVNKTLRALADVYTYGKRYREALGVNSFILSRNPKDFQAAYQSGQLYTYLRSYENSDIAFSRATQIDRGRAEAWLAWGESLSYRRDPVSGRADERAEDALNNALTLQPGNFRATLALANYYLYAGEFDKALPRYRTVLAKQPYNVEALVSYADALAFSGKPGLSVNQYSKALNVLRGNANVSANVSPETARALNSRASLGLARALVYSGRNAEGAIRLNQIVAADRNNVDALEALALAQAKLKSPNAASSYNRLLAYQKTNQDRARIYAAIGDLRLGQNNIPAATESYTQALNLAPNNAEYRLTYAELLSYAAGAQTGGAVASERAWAATRDAARAALEVAPNNLRAKALLLQALRGTGSTEDRATATQVASQLTTASPNNAQESLNMAQAMRELGLGNGTTIPQDPALLAAADRLFVRSFNQAKDFNTKVRLAAALRDAADYPRAIALYRQLVQSQPNNKEVRMGLAKTLFYNTNVSATPAQLTATVNEGLEQTNAVLAANPNDRDAQVLAAQLQMRLDTPEGRDAAARLANQILTVNANDAQAGAARTILTGALTSRARYAEAIQQAQAALAINPDNLEARLGLAQNYNYTRNTEASIREYRELIRRAPADVTPRLELAQILLDLSLYADAEALYNEVLTLRQRAELLPEVRRAIASNSLQRMMFDSPIVRSAALVVPRPRSAKRRVVVDNPLAKHPVSKRLFAQNSTASGPSLPAAAAGDTGTTAIPDAGAAAPTTPDAGTAAPTTPDTGAAASTTPDAGAAAPTTPDAGAATSVAPDAGTAAPVTPDDGATAPVSPDAGAAAPVAPGDLTSPDVTSTGPVTTVPSVPLNGAGGTGTGPETAPPFQNVPTPAPTTPTPTTPDAVRPDAVGPDAVGTVPTPTNPEGTGTLPAIDAPSQAAPGSTGDQRAALRGLGESRRRQNQLDEAAGYFNEAIRLDPNDLGARLGVARVRRDQKRFPEALTLVQGVLGVQNDNIPAGLLEVQLLNDLQRTEEANTRLNSVLSLIQNARIPVAESYIQAALSLNASRQYATSLDLLNRAATLFPTEPTVGRLRAQTLGLAGQTDESVAAYDALLTTDPRDAESLLGKARTLNYANRLADSEGVYRQALQAQPSNYVLQSELADVLARRNNYAEAVQLYESAVQSNPNSVPLRVSQARVLRAAGRPTEANAALGEVLRLEPTNVNALVERGLISGSNGAYAAGIADLTEALRLEPNNENAQLGLAQVQSYAGQYSESITNYQKFLTANPNSPNNVRARIELAQALSYAGRSPEALTELDTVLTQTPNDSNALLVRADILSRSNRPTEAVEIYNTLLTQNPENTQARIGLGDALLYARRYDDAIRTYDQLLVSDPNNNTIRVSRARALSYAGRNREAVAALRTIVAADATNVPARLALAEAGANSGNATLQRDAIGEYRAIIKDNPDNLNAQLGLARVLSYRGNYSEAQSILKPIVAANPANTDARLALADTQRFAGQPFDAKENLQTVARSGDLTPAQSASVRTGLSAVNRATSPSVGVFGTYYNDSNGVRLRSVGANAIVRTRPLTIGIIAERGKFRQNNLAERNRTNVGILLARQFGPVAAQLIVSRLKYSNAPERTLYNLSFNRDFSPRRRINLSFSRRDIFETDLAVGSGITANIINLTGSTPIGSRLDFDATATYYRYSDNNSRITLSPALMFRFKPNNPSLRVGLGYMYDNSDELRDAPFVYYTPQNFNAASILADYIVTNGPTRYGLSGAFPLTDETGVNGINRPARSLFGFFERDLGDNLDFNIRGGIVRVPNNGFRSDQISGGLNYYF